LPDLRHSADAPFAHPFNLLHFSSYYKLAANIQRISDMTKQFCTFFKTGTKKELQHAATPYSMSENPV
jgi:hypothetical protein